ncbi:hypothetical protein J6590_014739 [Homalodisca vitripennis]|nr:hypothetical protein J6590_014739 [Homalodisca vitripennis]
MQVRGRCGAVNVGDVTDDDPRCGTTEPTSAANCRHSSVPTATTVLTKRATSSGTCSASMWPRLESNLNVTKLCGVGVLLQALTGAGHTCEACGRNYKYKQGLVQHRRYECGKEPAFKCSFCEYRTHQKGHVKRHMFTRHLEQKSSLC